MVSSQMQTYDICGIINIVQSRYKSQEIHIYLIVPYLTNYMVVNKTIDISVPGSLLIISV